MSDNRHNEPYGDPFADRPRQTHFNEPPRMPRPYESTASLSTTEFGGQEHYSDDEYVEKQPLTQGQNFAGGFYPPGSV
jgi:chitin synthase